MEDTVNDGAGTMPAQFQTFLFILFFLTRDV